MKLRNALAWIALVIGALAITYTYAPSRRIALVDDSKRTVGPDFTLHDVHGKEVKLSDYKGKAVILNLWATWCGPCKVEIPWFKEFESTYKDRGLAIVGVAFDKEGWEVVTPYVNTAKMNYQVLMGDDKFPKPYGDFEALPTTYLIDKQGRIAGQHVGLVAKATYEEEINQLLKN